MIAAQIQAPARRPDPHAAVAVTADRLSKQLESWRTRAVIEAAVTELFAGRIALVSSFGAESAVLLHLVAGVARDTPVIFLDTGRLFAATHEYRERLTERLGLTDVRIAEPDLSDLADADSSSDLWQRDPDKCCGIRKVQPLAEALDGFDAWMSGRKRYQGGSREDIRLVEADGWHVKINPLAFWTKGDVTAYARMHELPDHPLVGNRFRSIGCVPCSDKSQSGEDDRAGRWRGTGKTECGIHLGLSRFESSKNGR